jgi:hypothetical protein
MGRIAFSNPKTEATYVVAECFARVACTEFGEYALGFFKEASPEWLDLTGNGSPNSLFPLRPLFGLFTSCCRHALRRWTALSDRK